ncbi:MAG: hypothetical protein OSJ71_08330, partial [Acetatifactor sp.]|nr:hypothetical protein [Acetatifactor sp.]
TPVNGFGDRRTTAVLFPYGISDLLTKAIITQPKLFSQVYFSNFLYNLSHFDENAAERRRTGGIL